MCWSQTGHWPTCWQTHWQSGLFHQRPGSIFKPGHYAPHTRAERKDNTPDHSRARPSSCSRLSREHMSAEDMIDWAGVHEQSCCIVWEAEKKKKKMQTEAAGDGKRKEDRRGCSRKWKNTDTVEQSSPAERDNPPATAAIKRCTEVYLEIILWKQVFYCQGLLS